MITAPRRLTGGQWWRIINSPKVTLLRLLQHECMKNTRLEGLSLDVGGGGEGKVDYRDRLSVAGQLHSVNIDAALFPTFLADFNRGLPLKDRCYDNIVSFNTLEHIFKDHDLLLEFQRVLKPGGSVYITVPFLYRVHSSPGDYHRHTATWWEKALKDAGFRETEIEILPLVLGVQGASLSLMEFHFPSFVRRGLRCAVFLSSLFLGRIFGKTSFLENTDMPLGFFIKAGK